MSMFDGLGAENENLEFSREDLETYKTILTESATTMETERDVEYDSHSTIPAVANASLEIGVLNDVRSLMGQYLTLDENNLNTIAALLEKLDEDTAGSYESEMTN